MVHAARSPARPPGVPGGLDLPPRAPGQPNRPWIYRALRDNIIRLHLSPGQALSEAEIAGRLRVSRTPVREAFIRLAEDGLLEIHPQRGSYVTLIDPGRAAEARFLRNVVEKAVLKEACRAFPEQARFELSANVEMQKFCRRERNYERMFQLDNEFHGILFRGCGKERLWRHLKRFDSDLDRLRVLQLSVKPEWDGIIHDHARIARLVSSRTAGPVDALLDRHLTQALHDRLVVQYPDCFRR